MGFYPKKVNDRFCHAKFSGITNGANAVATIAAFECGTAMKITLRIDAVSKEILEAKFKSSGCGFLIAAADVLIEKIIGRKLTDFQGFEDDQIKTELKNELGQFPPERKHCFDLSLKTLHSAFADFRAFQIEEFAGEKALICTCFSVSEERIEKLILENHLQTVEDVGNACSAGTGCGSCQPLIQEMIDSA